MNIHYIHLNTVDSTSTWAKAHVPPDASSLTCVTAQEQTGGRGQGTKSWVSPRGENIYASLCFSIPRHSPHLNELGLLLARSLVVILKKKGFVPHIKWPNDILIGNKKIAGVLTEAITTKDHIHVILGIGINVNMTPSHLAAIDQPATSLQLESPDQQPLECLPLLHALVEQFIEGINNLLPG